MNKKKIMKETFKTLPGFSLIVDYQTCLRNLVKSLSKFKSNLPYLFQIYNTIRFLFLSINLTLNVKIFNIQQAMYKITYSAAETLGHITDS